MSLYKIQNQSLKAVKHKPFKLEKEMQKLIEANLTEIMGLKFVDSEFTIKNKRIDTLAFNEEIKSFVIIEYKRDKNASVVDQGFAYLNLMLNNKSDFILAYNKKYQVVREDVDWSQVKVVFVAPNFTENQKVATDFPDLAIELWEVQRYEDNLLSFVQIKKDSDAGIKSNLISKKHQKIAKEIKVYKEEDHLEGHSEKIIELYQKFKEGILTLSDQIEAKATKPYMAFKIHNRSVCDITILKKGLKLWINKKAGSLKDPLGLTRDVSKIRHWGNGDYDLDVKDDSNLEYILGLIKQAIV